MAQVINGSDLMLFIGGKSIAFATSHKLTINAETVETTSKDNTGGWTSKQVKKLSWTANSENLYSAKGYKSLFTSMVGKAEVDAVFALKGETAFSEATGWAPATDKLTGKVIITSIDVNAPDGDNATFSVNFEGVGELKAVTA